MANLIFSAMASLLLLGISMFFVSQPSLRMIRLWTTHDEFEKCPLNFSLDGVHALWGYASWVGPFTANLTQFGLNGEDFVNETLRVIPPVLGHNIEGGDLVINLAFFSSGIGTHAPSKIAFGLQGKYRHFSCLVGLDKTSVNSRGVIYSVIADGREIFRSPILKADADPFPVDVSVAGVKGLILYADPTEFTNIGSNVDWVNLKFTP